MHGIALSFKDKIPQTANKSGQVVFSRNRAERRELGAGGCEGRK
jgi:hypothetical protein